MHIVALNCNICDFIFLYCSACTFTQPRFVSSQVSNYYFSVPDFSVPNHHAKVFITPKKILNYLISTVGRVHKGISFKFQSQ